MWMELMLSERGY